MPVHTAQFTPSIKFPGTHLYPWVERGTGRVKCLVQQHNDLSQDSNEPLVPMTSALTMHQVTAPLRETTMSLYKCRYSLHRYTDHSVLFSLPMEMRKKGKEHVSLYTERDGMSRGSSFPCSFKSCCGQCKSGPSFNTLCQ